MVVLDGQTVCRIVRVASERIVAAGIADRMVGSIAPVVGGRRFDTVYRIAGPYAPMVSRYAADRYDRAVCSINKFCK